MAKKVLFTAAGGYARVVRGLLPRIATWAARATGFDGEVPTPQAGTRWL